MWCRNLRSIFMTKSINSKATSHSVQLHEISSTKTPCERLSVLQVTCERGFASMEESHVKIVEELQRRHQQEVERLLVERERLLEEESAATATGEERLRI